MSCSLGWNRNSFRNLRSKKKPKLHVQFRLSYCRGQKHIFAPANWKHNLAVAATLWFPGQQMAFRGV